MLIPGSVWFEHVTGRYFLIPFHGSRSCLRCIESFTCKVSHRNSRKKTLGVLRYFKIAIKQFTFLIVSNSRDCSYQHHIVLILSFLTCDWIYWVSQSIYKNLQHKIKNRSLLFVGSQSGALYFTDVEKDNQRIMAAYSR